MNMRGYQIWLEWQYHCEKLGIHRRLCIISQLILIRSWEATAELWIYKRVLSCQWGMVIRVNCYGRVCFWTRFEINDVLRSSTMIQHTNYVPLKFEVKCVRTPKHKYFRERGQRRGIVQSQNVFCCSFIFFIEEFCNYIYSASLFISL